MYTIFISVKINTKERKDLQTKINKHSFFDHYLLSLSFFQHANIGQPMTDQECHMEIFFFEEGNWPYDIWNLAEQPTSCHAMRA